MLGWQICWCAQLLLHLCRSRQQCPAAISSIYFSQVRGFKAVSHYLFGLLHSCFPPGQTYTPHPLQKMFIFRQLLSCTTSPHNCLGASGRAGGKITQLVGRRSVQLRLAWAAGESRSCLCYKLPRPMRCGAALRRKQQALMKGRTDWGLTEVELIGMHDLHEVRANMSALAEHSQAICQSWCQRTHSVASFCSTSCALQALSCLSSTCPNYTHSAGQSGRQAIVMCPSCPDRSWGLQDLWIKQDLKTDPIRVVLRNPLDGGINNQPLISLLPLQEQKASSKRVGVTLSGTCSRQSRVQLFRAFSLSTA